MGLEEQQRGETIEWLHKLCKAYPTLATYVRHLYLIGYTDGMSSDVVGNPWSGYQNPFWPEKIWPKGQGFPSTNEARRELEVANLDLMFDGEDLA